MPPMHDPLGTIYKSIGKDEPYYRLVEEFYRGVEADPILRPLYPDDLEEPRRKLALFLIQRTGGHDTYTRERGHPRMRARHLPFPIGIAERDAWLVNMSRALDAVSEFDGHKADLTRFFVEFADFMRNKPG